MSSRSEARDPAVNAPITSLWGKVLFVGTTVAAVCALRASLGVYDDARAPFILFLAAVAASGRFAGWQAGAAATVLGLFAGAFFFAPPRGSFYIEATHNRLAAAAYVVASMVVVAVLAAEARARARLALQERQTVKERDEKLRLQTELESSRRLEAIGRLAGGVAHDFNNLLTIVLGSAALLRTKLKNEPLVEDIELAAQRGAALTKQLLGFARRQMLVVDTVSVNELVQESSRLLRRLLPEDVQLEFELHEPAWSARADRAQLQQVLMNLVLNARDALPSGGRVRIVTANTTLGERFTARNPEVTPGEYVQLSVIDDGVGMSDELQRRVFEPFFTTKPFGAGTGLGLAVSYGIVKQLQGHISVYSPVHGGTAFDVYLPRAVAAQPSAPAPAPEVAQSPPLTVLLVDDNEQVRTVLARTLRRLGHEVLVAEHGAHAIEVASAHTAHIDVLLTDVVMPWMNGGQLAERIREARPDLGVLFMSGYSDNVVLSRSVVKPGVDLLTKPFTSAALEAALRKVAARHAAAG